MLAKRQPDMVVILHHLPAGGHRLQCDGRLVDLQHGRLLARRGGGEEGKRVVAERLDRPERLAPGKLERGPEGVRLGQLDRGELRGGQESFSCIAR